MASETFLIPAPYAMLRSGIPVTVRIPSRAAKPVEFSGVFVQRQRDGVSASVGPVDDRYVVTVNLTGVTPHMLREGDKVLVDLLLRPVRDEATSALWVALRPDAPPLFTAPIFYREGGIYVLQDALKSRVSFAASLRWGSIHVPALAEVERAGGPFVAALATVISHVLGGTP